MLKGLFPGAATVAPSPTARTFADSMPSPTRRSSQSDGWVVIGTETEFEAGRQTKSRPPQRNDDNMSSVQLANASSNGAVLAQLGQNIGYTNARAMSAAATARKPESNGSSTETGVTDDTMTGAGAGMTGTMAQSGVPSAYPATPLTQPILEMHQRELALLHTPSISGWVDGAGIGSRLTRGFSASSAYTIFTVSSMPSISSTAPGQDWTLVPHPMATDHQVADAGAWCDDLIGPPVAAFSRISLCNE